MGTSLIYFHNLKYRPKHSAVFFLVSKKDMNVENMLSIAPSPTVNVGF